MAFDNIKTGIVESIDDPTKAGRIKVRVAGLHDHIKTEELPWCTFGGSGMFSGGGGGSISIPRVGAEVRVSFKGDSPTDMEWSANNIIDKDLINEISSDYAGSTVIFYDSRQDVSIKFQPGSGLLLYYGGSHIQIMPDNTINIHYGEGTTGTQIQLSNGKVDIQAQNQINISTPGTLNLEADSITVNGKSAVQIKGDAPGQVAANGKALISALLNMATIIDAKVPQSGGSCVSFLNSSKEGILNQQIQYI